MVVSLTCSLIMLRNGSQNDKINNIVHQEDQIRCMYQNGGKKLLLFLEWRKSIGIIGNSNKTIKTHLLYAVRQFRNMSRTLKTLDWNSREDVTPTSRKPRTKIWTLKVVFSLLELEYSNYKFSKMLSEPMLKFENFEKLKATSKKF